MFVSTPSTVTYAWPCPLTGARCSRPSTVASMPIGIVVNLHLERNADVVAVLRAHQPRHGYVLIDAASLDRQRDVGPESLRLSAWGDAVGPDGGIDALWGRVVAQPTLTRRLHDAHAQGTAVWNTPFAVDGTRDKWTLYQRLTALGVPMPLTQLVEPGLPLDVSEQIAHLWPKVVKPTQGMQSRGVHLVDDADSLAALVALQPIGENWLLQPYVPCDQGGDIRVYVVDDTVIGAVRRVPAPGDWIGIEIRGGHAHRIEIDDAVAAAALSAARGAGLHVTGIDIVTSEEGPVVLDVNPVPGLVSAHRHGIDLIGTVVEGLTRFAARY